MRSTELVYFPGCPHVTAAREALGRAFAMLDLPPAWTEYRTDDPGLPEHAHGFGSPTILVDGRDVSGIDAGGSASSCRLYLDDDGRPGGVPQLQRIVAALAGELP
jgi:hypothetical protein